MNKITAETEFLIIGLGVIGGSYAEALSRKGYKVKAITKEQKEMCIRDRISTERYTAMLPEIRFCRRRHIRFILTLTKKPAFILSVCVRAERS